MLLSLVAAVTVGTGMAQPGSVQSVKVNPDNTVTFNYRNDNARKVQVWVQYGGDIDMAKGADGVWSVTTGAAAPDLYPYHFTVDGVSVMDEQNSEYFPNETFKNSLLDIPGDGNMIHALKDVPHGNVDYLQYWSEDLGMYIPLIVYTPPFYNDAKNRNRHYPVMYLISGTTDTEEVYFKVGKMNLILDNLIAQGKAKEMILVLPYGNATLLKTERQPQAAGGMGMMGGMGMGFGGGYNFNKDFTDVMMPFVEARYRTINDAAHRGIGGFSRGGNQGLAIGLANLDKFSYLCSYSSFTQVRASQFEDADAVNAKINLFWSGIGTDDFLYGNSKDLMQTLDKAGIKNIKEFTYDKYGHTWMNARYWLDKSFRLLFQDAEVIAAEKGMDLDEAEKVRQASAAAGEESRLTPALMSSLFPAGVKSPEYNASGTVTFRCQAPDARKVEFEGDFFRGRREMQNDGNGVWSITVDNPVPGQYRYAFVIDGTPVADQNNMHLAPANGLKYSICDVRSDQPGVTDVQKDVEQGKVTYTYFKDHDGRMQPMCIYTPAGYDPKGKEKLPVVYMLAGKSETYEAWFKNYRVNTILDNMIAKGDASRMIVVMTESDVYQEQIQYMQKNYAVRKKSNQRAIVSVLQNGTLIDIQNSLADALRKKF